VAGAGGAAGALTAPEASFGATLHADALPRSAVLADQPAAHQLACMLAGGDDYELLFTAAPDGADAVHAAARASATAVSRIGRIEAAAGVRVLDRDGQPLATPWASFDHFR
jgi:thiamine-monophosphate kinase